MARPKKKPEYDSDQMAQQLMASKCGGYIGRETIIQGKPSLPHGFHGVHISRRAVIGKDVTILQNVTIGNKNAEGATIGDGVFIGANAVVIGKVSIGNNVKIGAGAIIVEDIPDNCTAVGNKARIIWSQIEKMYRGEPIQDDVSVIKEWEHNLKNYVYNTKETETAHMKQEMEIDAYSFAVYMLIHYFRDKNENINIGLPPITSDEIWNRASKAAQSNYDIYEHIL